MKTFMTLAAPGVIIMTAATLVVTLADQSAVVSQAARGYPLAAIGLALILAWRLERNRLFAAAAALLTIHLVFQPWSLADQQLLNLLAATFVPIGFACLTLLDDARFSVQRSVGQLLVIFAPAAVAAFFSAGDTQGAVTTITRDYVDPIYMDWLGVPQLSALAAIVAIAISLVRAIRTQRAAEAGIVWIIVACVVALSAAPATPARAVWILAAALVLNVALVETAYGMAFYDELTGLPARRALKSTLAALEAPYAIAVVDIDRFKSFNDEHGHHVGDQVLRMVAARLARVGGGGRAFRSGGEEFTIVFAGLDKRAAQTYVEAVRAAVADTAFALRDYPRPKGNEAASRRGRSSRKPRCLKVTISAGLAAASAQLPTPEAVTRAADKAMYRAKDGGRNRVVA